MDPRLTELLDLLDAADGDSIGTSVRIPTALRRAAALAAEMGLTASTTELTVRGLREQLGAVGRRAALDAHYERYPEVRPDLAEIAHAAAELDDNPLRNRPELIRRAAEEIVRIMPDATPRDVLTFAAGLAAAA